MRGVLHWNGERKAPRIPKEEPMPDDALCEVEGCSHPSEAEFTTTEGTRSRGWRVCAAHKRSLDEGASFRTQGDPDRGGSIVLTGG